MRGDAVLDARGVIHRVQGGPETFSTMPGGLPGKTWCGVLFYDEALGPKSCTFSRAVPMARAEDRISCMTCLVRACR